MRKIAIANRKGGVGKTTTAVNLAHGLSISGKRVLLIDTDTQGHCSRALGTKHPYGLAEVIEGVKNAPQSTVEARSGLFLLPGGKKLGGTQRLISRRNMRAEYTLLEALKPFENRYDFVILDTPPGFNELSINVLFYASEVLVPVSMEILALDGLKAFLEEVKGIREYSDIAVKYITPTFVDYRVKKTVEILKLLQNHFKELVTVPIRYSSRLSESPGWGKTIFEYDRTAKVAQDYAQLTKAML